MTSIGFGMRKIDKDFIEEKFSNKQELMFYYQHVEVRDEPDI